MRWPPSSTAVPDLIGGTLLSLLGLVFLIGGTGYGLWTPDGQLEPGAMPFLAGCLLAVLGPSIAVSALRTEAHKAQDRSPAAAGGSSPAPSHEPETSPPQDPAAVASRQPHDGDTAAAEAQDETVDRPWRALALFALTAVAVAAITWFDIFIVLAALVTAILVFFENVRWWKAATTAVVLALLCYLVFAVLLGVPLPTVF